ncbi:taxadiene 5-alpha hydroxylase-like isoform X2 [Rutidosis leptorrhynchoides]|uniref:taxadiene 5-alpha hydroxylase-like isoform X2 n=1 Tax=Rutidosis leptorrhynchoides TaxID=125765 RepID=UPI003A99352C
MDLNVLLSMLLSFLISVLIVYRATKKSRKLPPGSLGLPLIGQSLDFVKALKAGRVEDWFDERKAKHGPVWKARLLGYPTVVLYGTTANKLIYTDESNAFSTKLPPSIRKIVGPKNIKELSSEDHKRVRAAMVSFLKLDVLKQYVVKVDEEIQDHLQSHWHGKNEIQVRALAKKLTFNMICSLLFGIERGHKRERLLPLFQDMMKSLVSLPIDVPFTQFSRGLRSRKKLVTILLGLVKEKREALKEKNQGDNLPKDLITSLLTIHDDTRSKELSNEEIIDTIIVVMIGGYDTTATLLTFLIRIMANDELIYSKIVQEQAEISKTKAPGEALTWADLIKMKYTWLVASEALRINPPGNLIFRRTTKDIDFGGYVIPKGWQVILSPHMTQMDDTIFPNPTMFDPTRFDTHAQSRPPYSFVAFGAGPRICPGMEFAKMETLAMIHHLVTQFKWELVNKEESFIPLHFFNQDQDMLVRIKPLSN